MLVKTTVLQINAQMKEALLSFFALVSASECSSSDDCPSCEFCNAEDSTTYGECEACPGYYHGDCTDKYYYGSIEAECIAVCVNDASGIF